VAKVKFECSCGDFVVEVNRDWAPNGVDRLLELVAEGFFSDVRFFRVVTKPRPFIVQFGISGDPDTAAAREPLSRPTAPGLRAAARFVPSYAADSGGPRPARDLAAAAV